MSSGFTCQDGVFEVDGARRHQVPCPCAGPGGGKPGHGSLGIWGAGPPPPAQLSQCWRLLSSPLLPLTQTCKSHHSYKCPCKSPFLRRLSNLLKAAEVQLSCYAKGESLGGLKALEGKPRSIFAEICRMFVPENNSWALASLSLPGALPPGLPAVPRVIVSLFSLLLSRRALVLAPCQLRGRRG